LVEKDVRKLCVTCHTDVEAGAKAAKHSHAPVEGECTVCHSPHASRQEKLVKLPAGGVCLSCHPEMGAGKGEFGHGIIDDYGCQACHEPHGGSNPKLLRVVGASLCLGCHDPKKLKPAGGADHVILLGRFRVPAKRAGEIHFPQLSADGQRNHPIAGHRVLGVSTKKELEDSKTRPTFTGELTCTSCHDPHKGKTAKLLARGATSTTASCSFCHPK
jgi:predicted CXXCH cytochrome family protein